MIRHLLRIVWNRKKVNTLILLEILVSFMALFALLTGLAYFFHNYRQPLGFQDEDVWTIQISIPRAERLDRDQCRVKLNQIAGYFQSLPEVLHSGEAIILPYEGSIWNEHIETQTSSLLANVGFTTPGMEEIMGIDLIEGRWFEPGDTNMDKRPAVVNRRLARMLYGHEPAFGKVFQMDESTCRVIGIVNEYHPFGDFSHRRPFVFFPMQHHQRSYTPEFLVLRVQSSSSVELEEEIVNHLEAITPGWSFRVAPLTHMRGAYLRQNVAMMVTTGSVVLFMLIMVAMGMVGVLWQNVTQRTSEMGLRRAKGATRPKIYLQILGEFLVITTIAIAIGVCLIAQIPFLGIQGQLPTRVILQGFFAAVMLIYALTLISSLYPSWLATTIHPAEALHYE